MTHPNAWPDSPPPRRRHVDIEPWELMHQQRQHDAERTASQKWHASQPAHGTEGCADTSDEARVYASGWVHALVYGTSSAVSLLAVAVMAGWL